MTSPAVRVQTVGAVLCALDGEFETVGQRVEFVFDVTAFFVLLGPLVPFSDAAVVALLHAISRLYPDEMAAASRDLALAQEVGEA